MIGLKEKLDKKQLLKVFFDGCKKSSDFKVGIEYERLCVNLRGLKSADYQSQVYRLLRQIAYQDEWNYLVDNNSVIGLKKGQDIISLEPGTQFEISLAPEKNICDIEKKLENLNKKINKIAKNLGICLLEYGISPVSHGQDIELIPKKRYALMANFLTGSMSHVMMRETAGIQVAFDFESESDAIKKLRLAMMVSPVATAMFANSPVRTNKDTGFKSYRALSWLNCDPKRCNLISKNLFNFNYDFKFEDYLDALLEVPMIFIVRNKKNIQINGKINFKQFIRYGYDGISPTLEDYKLHSSLYFPDVRLKNYLEIRNHDTQTGVLKYAIPAFYKGLLHNEATVNEALSFLKDFYSNDISNKEGDFIFNELLFAKESAAKNGLNGKICAKPILELAKEMLKISHSGLNKIGLNEQKYLEPIIYLVEKGLCPADIILKNWYGSWNKDITKLID